jgi:hypothetical protein
MEIKHQVEGDEDNSSFDSMEGKPEEYVKFVETARVLFENEEEAEFYSKNLVILGTSFL